MAKRKKLNKKLLTDLLIRYPQSDMYKKVLDTDEIKSLQYHQWTHPDEQAHKNHHPDFEKIFEKIKAKTIAKGEKRSKSTEFLIHEVDYFKNKYTLYKKRVNLGIGIAASVIILLSVSAISYITSNNVFEHTYTKAMAPMGQKSQVVLPDGTVVHLNAGTVLRYDNFFGKRYRHLELSGEAYFEVEHDDQLPFIIQTSDVEVKVLGTKFGVMAYADDKYIETTVSEGEVRVAEIEGPATLRLKANQQAKFHKHSKNFELHDVNDLSPYTSWKDDQLTFDNENFANVIKKIERWYGVNIHIQGKDSLEERYTLKVRNESLSEVLDLISMTSPFDYTIDDEEVTIIYKNN